MLCVGYCIDIDVDVNQEFVYFGFSVGVIISVLLSKECKSNILLIDYVYCLMKVWDGMYNFGVWINL